MDCRLPTAEETPRASYTWSAPLGIATRTRCWGFHKMVRVPPACSTTQRNVPFASWWHGRWPFRPTSRPFIQLSAVSTASPAGVIWP